MAIMDNNREAPQNTKTRTLILFSNPTSRYTAQGTEISVAKRYLQPHIYCSIIYNSRDMEIT